MAKRDMSEHEYIQAIKRRGWVRSFGNGYVDIGDGHCVSTDNAPHQTNRGRLAYLIARRKELDKKQAAT